MSRVLLVDDDPNLLDIAERILPREEPTVNLVTATSAQEALQKMKEEGFDAVVSDYQMPGMDGLVFLQTLRDEGNTIPFIIFTGQGREEVAMDALNLGADYYLMKGAEVKSTFGELAHIIRQVIEHRQTEEALRESEARFAAFMEHIPAVTFIRDLQDRHIFVNKLGEKYNTEAWHYKTNKDLWPEDTANRLRAIDQKVLSEKRSIQTIETLPGADGVLHLLTVKFPILDENGEPQYLAGAAIDITEQKIMEKALQVQQEFTDKVIDSLTDTFYIFDPEDGRAIRWNKVFEEIGGYSYEEMKQNMPLDYYPPEEHSRIEKSTKEILETGRGHVELTWITKSGRRVPFEYSAVLIKSPEGKPWICAIGRDISERKQIEAKLKESEEKFRRIVEDQTEFIVRWLPGGVRTFVNESYCRYLGKSAEELLGVNFFPLIDERDLPAVRKQIEALSPENPICTGEHRFIHSDESIGWHRWTDRAIFNDEGQIIEYQSVGQDITDQRQAEAALRESEEKYHSLISNIPVVTWLSDSEGGTSFISPNVEKIYGFTPEEIYERGEELWFKRIHPDDVERVKGKYQALFATKEPFEVEYRIQRKDGKWIWLYDRAITIFEEEGKAQAYGVFEDITKRKQMEDALHESEQQFRAIFENIGVGMVAGSFDGRIAATNSAFQKFLGYSAEELKQITYREYTHPEDLPRDEELFQEMLEEKRNYYQIEKRYIRKDGQIKWGRLTSSIVRDEIGHPPFGIGMVEDITEHKHAEAALQKSEALFQVLLNSTDDSVLLLDTEGTILAVNKAEMRRLNKTEEELLGSNTFDHFPLAVDDQRKNAFDEVIQSGNSIRRVSEDSGRIFESNMSPIFGPSGNVERVAIFSWDITDRERIAEELERSEKQYRALVEQSLQSLTILQDNRIVFANPAAQQITGYTLEEYLAFSPKDFNALIHPMDREMVLSRIQDRLVGKPVVDRYECRMIHKNGSIRWVELQSIPITFHGRPAIQTAALDITDRKRAEERFRSIYEQSPIAIEIYNREGELIEANPECLRLFGIDSLTEVKGFKLLEDPNLPTDAKERLLKGKPVAYEAEFDFELVKKHNLYQTSKSGQCFVDTLITPLREDEGADQPSGYLVQVTDITERKQAEMAYQSVIESMVHGIAIYQEGQFVFVNRAMREITGYRVEELLAFSIEEMIGVVHPDDLELLIKRQRDWLEGNPVHPRYSCRLIRKDGTFRWIEGFTNPVEFQGKPATQQTIIDISDRKQAQELLQQQKKELSDFVHMMAHDLRNQLLSVEGYAETLQEEYNQTFVEKIQYLAQHMGQLLRRSVALADAGLVIEGTADVDLAQLVQEISETAIPNNIDFVVDDLPIVVGDREKLVQVFQNLFENAVTHGNPTKISVRKQRGERGTKILVANDGKPILPEHRSKIFQRGFSTQEERSGLGLAIVQKLVAAHGWQIGLADTPETAFIIQIPTSS